MHLRHLPPEPLRVQLVAGVSRVCLAGVIFAAVWQLHWAWLVLLTVAGVGALLLETHLWMRWVNEETRRIQRDRV